MPKHKPTAKSSPNLAPTKIAANKTMNAKNRIKKLRHKYGVVDFDRVIKWSEAISYHLFY
jgi:hypothetical protein